MAQASCGAPAQLFQGRCPWDHDSGVGQRVKTIDALPTRGRTTTQRACRYGKRQSSSDGTVPICVRMRGDSISPVSLSIHTS